MDVHVELSMVGLHIAIPNHVRMVLWRNAARREFGVELMSQFAHLEQQPRHFIVEAMLGEELFGPLHSLHNIGPKQSFVGLEVNAHRFPEMAWLTLTTSTLAAAV
jgi:hypothetical protein